MKSVANMIAQLAPLVGTTDLTEWERRFVADMQRFIQSGAQTTAMSEKQAEIVGRIYRNHYGDSE